MICPLRSSFSCGILNVSDSTGEGERILKQRARKNPTARTWPTETPYTGRVSVRLPLGVRDRLRNYAEITGQTTTDCIVVAVQEYLSKRGY